MTRKYVSGVITFYIDDKVVRVDKYDSYGARRKLILNFFEQLHFKTVEKNCYYIIEPKND